MTAYDWEELARQHFREHRHNWTNDDLIDVDYAAYDVDDADAYGNWSANVTFNIDKDEFIETFDTKNINTKELTKYIRSAGFNQIDGFKISKDKYEVSVVAKLKQREAEGLIEEFESFLDDIDSVDSDYEDILSYIKAWLTHQEYIKTNNIAQKYQELNFQHLKLELNQNPSSQSHYYLKSQEIPIGNLANFPSDKDYISSMSLNKLWLPCDLIKQLNANPPLPNELKIDKQVFFTIFKQQYSSLNTQIINNILLDPNQMIAVIYSFNIGMNDQEENINNIFQIAKQLDNNFDHINEQLKIWWNNLKDKLNKHYQNKITQQTQYQNTKT